MMCGSSTAHASIRFANIGGTILVASIVSILGGACASAAGSAAQDTNSAPMNGDRTETGGTSSARARTADAPPAVDPASDLAVRLDALSPFRPGPLPDAANLTGTWSEVASAAPPGPFRRPTPCYEGLGWVAIVQAGDAVMLRRHFPQPVQGMVPVETRVTTERASGRRDGDAVIVDGTLDVETTYRSSPRPPRREVHGHPHWRLVYDRPSGHLVGKRDGALIRLAPLVLVPRVQPGEPARPNPCGPPPP